MRSKQLKRVNSAWFVALFAVICLVVSGNLCFAQKTQDIRTKVMQIQLDYSKVIYPIKSDRNTKFIQSNLRQVKSFEEFKKGQIVGLLKTGTPPQDQYIYVWNENNMWKGVVASDIGTTIKTIGVNVIENGHKIGKNIDNSTFSNKRKDTVTITVTITIGNFTITITFTWEKSK